MVSSLQHLYGRNLISERGYPLWRPEPSITLPDEYVRDGLQIGDVGVVVPDGSFDVLFNICSPSTHPLHRETGVPDNFTPILLNQRDITKLPEAESAGSVITSPSVMRVGGMSMPDKYPQSDAQPGYLDYRFALSSREGAALILPEGAELHYLRNEHIFLDVALRHAVDWYTFAERRLGRIISHDSLYLITGTWKSWSWTLATYRRGQSMGAGKASAHFQPAEVGTGNLSARYTCKWESTEAMDWRAGPSRSSYHFNGIPNQTVFIQGFKIAVREEMLRNRIPGASVASIPSVRPSHANFSFPSWLSDMWSRLFTGGDNSIRDHCNKMFSIRRFPRITKPFHPCDIINRRLLQNAPYATVAVTHDSQWMTLLQRGLLDPQDLSRENHLIASVIDNHSVKLTPEGAVYLYNAEIENLADSLSSSDLHHTDVNLVSDLSSFFVASLPEAAQILQPLDNKTNEDLSTFPGQQPAQPNRSREASAASIPLQPIAKKRALLIAIQHCGRGAELESSDPPAHRDTEALRDFLIGFHGYHPDDVVLMKDDANCLGALWPSPRKILNQIDRLTHNLPEDCHLFFYFSGHGLTHEKYYGRANSALDDECISASGKPMLDHLFHDRLVMPLRKVKGSKLFALFDCCHPENVPSLQIRDGPRCLRRIWRYTLTEAFKVNNIITLSRLSKKRCGNSPKNRPARAKWPSPPIAKTYEIGKLSVIFLASCREKQFVGDHREMSFTKCFLEVAQKKPHMTWIELRGAVEREMIWEIRRKYEAALERDTRDVTDDGHTCMKLC